MILALLTDSELRVRYVLRILSNIVAWQLSGWYFHARLGTDFLRCYVLGIHLLLSIFMWQFSNCTSTNLSSLVGGYLWHLIPFLLTP